MIDVGCLNPTSQQRIGQPEHMFVCEIHTERFDQMSEVRHTSSASSPPIQALRERIERDAPWLQVLDLVESPYPFVRVKDTINGIIVGFSSEADYTTYIAMMPRTEVNRHA
jgi:hypothetical protein